MRSEQQSSSTHLSSAPGTDLSTASVRECKIMNMPRLLPLDVPWRISPSVPCLGVALGNVFGINDGYVTFDAFLGESTSLANKYGTHRQISVALKRVVWMKFYPEFSKDDSERLEAYDWNQVPEFRDQDGSFRGHSRRFHDQWNSTDICPDPSAYLIENSEALACLGFRDEFKHYLFIGDDFNLEVIADSLTWELLEST